MGMIRQLLENDSGAEFLSGLKWLIVILTSCAGSFCVLYAIYIGYLFATATDASKRSAARNRLFKVISSLLIIVALAFCMNAIDVKFSTPVADDAEGGETGDLFEGMTGVGGGFIYSHWETPKFQIAKDNIAKIEINYKYICQNKKAIDGSKFGGLTNFHLQINGSAFENDYGSAETESNNPIVASDKKTLTYYYKNVII